MKLHIDDHPLEALSVAVVPGAETSTFLWPEINHLSSAISWVGDDSGQAECKGLEAELTPFIADIIVDPEEEELVLEENVEIDICGPEEELIHAEWETALEEIGRSLLEWDSEESLSGGSVVSSELNWPGLIGIVSSSSILKWNGQPAGWGESHNTTNQWLIRVTIDEFLWRPSTTENILPG